MLFDSICYSGYMTNGVMSESLILSNLLDRAFCLLIKFRVGGRNEGSASLFSGLLLATYEANHGLKPGQSPYTDKIYGKQ